MVNLNSMKKAVVLRKPSGTIAIAGNLDIRERKFYNVFLKVVEGEVKKDIRKFIFDVPLEMLKSTLNVRENDKNNTTIRKIIKGMHKIDVEYNILGKDKTIDGYASLLDNIEFERDRGGNTIVRFSIPEIVRKSFINQKNEIYASIDLVIVKGLTSKYAVLLYELAKDYEKVEIPIMTVEKFRKLFGVENKYSKMPDLRRRVLDVACKEINDNPNIEFLVDYKLKKQGKAYTHIKFTVKPKPAQLKLAQQAKSLIQNETPEFTELMALIPETYRNNISVIRIISASLKEKGFDYTKAQIIYTNSQKNLKNYPAYLKKAIEENYAELIIKKMEEEQKRLEIQKRLEKFYGKRIVFKKRYIGALSRDGMIIDGTNSAFAIGDIEEGVDEIELFDEYIKEKVIDRVFVYTDKNGVEKQYKVLELGTTPEFLTNKFPAKIQDMDTGEKLGAEISSTLILEIGERKREPKELILE